MALPDFPDGDQELIAIVEAFNALTDQERLNVLIQIGSEDEELRQMILDDFRRRGLIA